MRRRDFTSRLLATVAPPVGWGLSSTSAHAADVSESDAAGAIRAALGRGVASAIDLLGRPNGFLGNPEVKIELPGFLNDAAKLLRFTGQQGRVDELVTAMNRAAEMAVPKARPLLLNVVRSMSVDDARRIIAGGDDSVTQFFEHKTRVPLGAEFRPIVDRATERVALADKYNAVAGRVASLGLLKGDDANIQSYVTSKALDGLYLMIGEEERKIRRDPIATGSALLQKVFGSLR